MPSPCSIPGCRTNRSKNDPVSSVFNFPKDPVRKAQWEWAVRQLHDSTYLFREGSKICMRHFEVGFIEREHRAVRDDGSILTIPRKAATLRDTAVPTLFDFLPDPHPNGQPYRSTRTGISCLSALKKELDLRLRDELHGWNVVYNEDLPALSICKIAITEELEPEIKVSVTFNRELVVKIAHCDFALHDVNSALGDEWKCDNWHKLRKLLSLLNGEEPPEKKCKMKVFETGNVVVLEISQEQGEVKIKREPTDGSGEECDQSELTSNFYQ